MKSRKKYLVFTIVFFILCFGMYGVYQSLYSADKQTLHTTYEFTATVTDVDVRHGDTIYVTIHTKEFDDALQLFPAVTERMNLTGITSLKSGQVITFRIENSKLQRFAAAGFGEVVALKTEEKEILSLEEYNQYQHESVTPARITAMVAAILFFLLAIFFLLKLRGINPFRKRNKA